MLKNEFMSKVAEKAGCRKSDVAIIMDAFHDVVVNAIAEGDEVKPFKGITLSGVRVEQATRRNPQTGEPVVVPAHIRPKAKFSPSLKDEVNL